MLTDCLDEKKVDHQKASWRCLKKHYTKIKAQLSAMTLERDDSVARIDMLEERLAHMAKQHEKERRKAEKERAHETTERKKHFEARLTKQLQFI